MSVPHLILASTSRYRRELLGRLGLPFDTASPGVDESSQPGEQPAQLASRLAMAKAQAVAMRHPEAWVIGSDQVAELDGRALGKPGGRVAAIAQLQAMRGRGVCFHTALTLCHNDRMYHHRDLTQVQLRTLDDAEISRYVDAEQPYDSAGSFKVEGLGISLFQSIQSDDPTALIGLPLIATARLLRQAGYRLP